MKKIRLIVKTLLWTLTIACFGFVIFLSLVVLFFSLQKWSDRNSSLAKDRALDSRVSKLGALLNTYYDEEGKYPASLIELEKKYSKEKMSKIDNPFTPESGYGEDYSDLSNREVITEAFNPPKIHDCKGMVLYQPVLKQQGHIIIGCDYFDAEPQKRHDQKRYVKKISSADAFGYKKGAYGAAGVIYNEKARVFEVTDVKKVIEWPIQSKRLETTQESLHATLQKYYAAKGKYPDSLLDLQKYAVNQKIGLDLYNPFTVEQGYGNAFWDLEKLRFRSQSHDLQLLPPGCGNMFLYQAAYQNQGYMIVYCPESDLSPFKTFAHESFVYKNKNYGSDLVEYDKVNHKFKLSKYDEEWLFKNHKSRPQNQSN